MLQQLNLPTFSQLSLSVGEMLLQAYTVSWDACGRRMDVAAGSGACTETSRSHGDVTAYVWRVYGNCSAEG